MSDVLHITISDQWVGAVGMYVTCTSGSLLHPQLFLCSIVRAKGHSPGRAMPGYRVHAFFTAAVVDGDNMPMPAGLVDIDLAYAGSLLFMSDPSHDFNNYEVYHSLSNVCMGPFSQAYALLGRIHQVYPAQHEIHAVESVLSWTDRRSMREVHLDPRVEFIRRVCGYGKPIHQIWAFANARSGLDLYVQTIGCTPPDMFMHYWVNVVAPSDWWRAQSYQFVGPMTMPDWAPRPLRSAL